MMLPMTFTPNSRKTIKIYIVLPAVLVRFLQSRTVYVVHKFIFTHLDHFLLSFLGEHIACETTERRQVVYILVNRKGK